LTQIKHPVTQTNAMDTSSMSAVNIVARKPLLNNRSVKTVLEKNKFC